MYLCGGWVVELQVGCVRWSASRRGESRRDAQLSGLMEQLSETEEKNEDLLKSNSWWLIQMLKIIYRNGFLGFHTNDPLGAA